MSFALLDPRLWLALLLALAAAFGSGYFKGRNDGTQISEAAHLAAQAAATADVRRLENARQSRADDAGRLASAREIGLRNDAARAGDALRGLRRHLANLPACGEPGTAPAVAAVAVRELLGESADAYRELAATCDGHASDVRLLLDAWPK